jgi:large subunit ribosomal protein L37Ae
MAGTKKVGMTGKFGPRYGIKIRRAVLEVTKKMTKECPYCGRKQLKRTATGIWECGKCNTKFTGGAYTPVQETSAEESEK